MSTPTDPALPELGDDRIATMERTVFARISTGRDTSRTRRRRWWIAGGSAAAVVLVAAVIAPTVTANLGGDRAVSLVAPATGTESGPLRLLPGTVPLQETSPSLPGSTAAGSSAADAASGTSRQNISTANAAVVVDDVRAAAAAIRTDAEARGGHVESLSVGATGASVTDAAGSQVLPYPGAGDGWITVRVPADQLTAAITSLDAVGEVTTSSVSSQDVTDQTIDLRARIAAAEASVTRLTELMSQAQSTADLIAAESALQQRQAALDSDRQQLANLEGQIELASLSVQLTARTTTVTADPAGFGDGLAAGWNGLVATLNGLVIALGFLLPWIVVLAVIGAVVWAIVAVRRRIRRRPRARRAGIADEADRAS